MDSSEQGMTTAEVIEVLDVRPIAPRERFDRLMQAYQSVPDGGTLELTVDHDPASICYILRSTHGMDAFACEVMEAGPAVWRMELRKR